MELISVINNRSIFKISGNARIKILNDYCRGLINKNNILFKNGNMFVTSSNLENINVPDYKCHVLFDYFDKLPNVSCIWDYDGYIPYYLHPNKNINLKILDEFDIKKNSVLYQYLSQINPTESNPEEILDKDYTCDRFIEDLDLNSNMYYKKTIYPSYIHNDGEFIRINNTDNSSSKEMYKDDLEITDISSDYGY
jgi:hypothetical protein